MPTNSCVGPLAVEYTSLNCGFVLYCAEHAAQQIQKKTSVMILRLIQSWLMQVGEPLFPVKSDQINFVDPSCLKLGLDPTLQYCS